MSVTTMSTPGTSFLINLSRNLSEATNMTRISSSPDAENIVTTKVYWIPRSPDYTVLYVTVPIAAGMLFTVLVFFLWVFSSKPESLQEDCEYERLEEEEPVAGSSSRRHQIPSSPTHPIVDQILDLPYTNPMEVNDDLPVV